MMRKRTKRSSDIRPKRERDAEVSRKAILDAAEEIFAEHGFDGARIDAIAAASGYNKSLIFHYFDDKLGLYTAVVRRIKEQVEHELTSVLQLYASEEGYMRLTHEADAFRAFLEMLVRIAFDFLLARPDFLRILA